MGTPRQYLKIEAFCAEFEIARSTFYDWRAKGRAALYQAAERRAANPSRGYRELAYAMRGGCLMDDISYDVRIYKTDVWKSKKEGGRTTYWVRWKVGKNPRSSGRSAPALSPRASARL
jgi:hypothetical protein